MVRTQSTQIETRFLRDTPADRDFFGTHSDLAKAVGSALASNPELRTIGLLGKWGSGKSTVLAELNRTIQSTTALSDIKIFVFDAWEHQGEPIRRSFLESLFRFLTQQSLIVAEEWRPDVDLLAGRLNITENIETPELTKPARRLLLSLALIPFGLSVFGLNTLHEGLGRTTTQAGQLALVISMVCFSIPGVFILHALFRARGSSEKADGQEVFGLIINKKVNRTKTRTIKSPEPTAIEFSETCDGLTAEVKKRNHRLLCVVDNLDRLPAQEALDIWSAIRALFANTRSKGDDSGHPFVLVPMDHSALLASFGGNADDERAKSFIDKTFDITFRVPPPVRSDWKAFLRKQMETVFGENVIEDRTMYFIDRVFDNKHNTANEFPTPRIINRFVNSVAATWLARQVDNFPLAVVSLFVSYFEDIDESVLSFTQREDTHYFDEDFPDWRDQVAALYFGVKSEKSRQVLLERPLREAISAGDKDAFEQLMRYPGSFKVFRDTLTEYQYDTQTTDSQAFIFECSAMLELIRDNQEGVTRLWDFLLSRLVESAPVPTLDGLDEIVNRFLRHVRPLHLDKLISVSVGWLSRRASSTSDGESVTAIANIYELLKRSDPSGKASYLTIRGEPLALINAIYWMNDNEILESSIRVGVEFSKLAPELAKLVGDEDEALTVHEVLAFRRKYPQAFPSENNVELAPIRDASTAIMRTSGISSLTKWAARNLGVMAPITARSGEIIDELIDAGHLQARLSEASGQDQPETIATLVALAIARGKTFAINLNADEIELTLDPMVQALDEFEVNPLNLIWNARAAGSAPEFMGRAMHFIIQHRAFSEKELGLIAQSPEFYFAPLSKADRSNLARKVGADAKRMDDLGKMGPSRMLLDILSPLIRLGVPDAANQCKASVERLPAQSWVSYLEGKADWILELIEKCPTDFKLTEKSAAVDAVVNVIKEQVAGLSALERTRLRRLLAYINPQAVINLISVVLEYSESRPRQVIGLLKTFSSHTTDFIANHASAEQLFALVGGVSAIADGRSWLEADADALLKGFRRLQKSRADIHGWFAGMRNLKPRIRANWIELMGNRLGLHPMT